ncbi:MAG: twin-arginine translocation signal domain-containing protein, partial [Pirellulales bacterium]
MSDRNCQQPANDPSRRKFLKTASALAVGGTFLGANARIARAAHFGGSDEIKVALVGCGARG